MRAFLLSPVALFIFLSACGEVSAGGPSARTSATAASVGGKTVLFGGVDANGNLLEDTWTFDGTTWTQETASGPSARAGASMTAM